MDFYENNENASIKISQNYLYFLHIFQNLQIYSKLPQILEKCHRLCTHHFNDLKDLSPVRKTMLKQFGEDSFNASKLTDWLGDRNHHSTKRSHILYALRLVL